MKWYWWILGALVILYFIGKQKNQSLQQELSSMFSFCGTLTSGDTFDGTISAIAPGVNEGNLSQSKTPIGMPTIIHCNIIPPSSSRRSLWCGDAPKMPQSVLYPVLPIGTYAL